MQTSRLPTQPALELSSEIAARGGLALEPGFSAHRAARRVGVHISRRHDGALYRTGRIEAMMHDLLHEVQPSESSSMRLRRTSAPTWKPLPRARLARLAAVVLRAARIAAGRRFGRTAADDGVHGGGWRRAPRHVLIAVITGSAFRRQLRLARLKTDLVAAVSHELRTPLASMRVLVDGLLADPRWMKRKRVSICTCWQSRTPA